MTKLRTKISPGRIAVGIGVIIMGIFACVGPEKYLIGFVVIIGGIEVILEELTGGAWNEFLYYGGGICIFTGVVLSFFFPVLIGPPFSSEALTRIAVFFTRALFTILSAYLIFCGIKERIDKRG